jgi:hypothetical protein
MVHFAPTNKHETPLDTARMLLHYVVKYHGIPRSIISDRDPKLMSRIWDEFTALLDIKQCHTSGYYLQANGLAERTNQTLRQILRVAAQKHISWIEALDTAEMAINNANHHSSEYSPYYLNLGYHPCLFPDVYSEASPENIRTETIESFAERMNTLWNNARAIAQTAQDTGIDQANRHRVERQFKVDDWVLVSVFPKLRKSLSVSGPFAARWVGPFRVTRVIAKYTYTLDLPESVPSRATPSSFAHTSIELEILYLVHQSFPHQTSQRPCPSMSIPGDPPSDTVI